MTITEALKKIKNKELTSFEIVSDCLKNIESGEKNIHAFLEVFKDEVIGEAKKEDERIKNENNLKPLSGIPIAIKDVMLISDKEATAGSKILQGFKSSYESTAVRKLKEAGAIILGRTNMDEFAMGSSTENSAFGPTKNPLDETRVPGGSSGGSGAAVAMGASMGALGSDTGGSIRQPASFCGLVGLKPTYGRVSRNGLIAMASSLDQIGPMTNTVEDAEIIYNVIIGTDPKDSTSFDMPTAYEKKSNIKIGVLKYDKTGVSEGVNKAFEDSIQIFEKMGIETEEISLPSLQYALACYYIIMPAEASTNLARFDGVKYGLSAKSKSLFENYLNSRGDGFGKEVRRRIILGTFVLSSGYYDAYYGKATKVRGAIIRDFEKIFSRFDAIITPTCPSVAFKLGEKSNNPLEMYLSDIFTVSVNIAKLPAISVPARLKGEAGLPVGLQIIAPWFREDILFNLGKKYELSSKS